MSEEKKKAPFLEGMSCTYLGPGRVHILGVTQRFLIRCAVRLLVVVVTQSVCGQWGSIIGSLAAEDPD